LFDQGSSHDDVSDDGSDYVSDDDVLLAEKNGVK
jgi:hypothetical protein